MKNIFKRALALTMTTALFAVSAFAAPAPEYSSVSYDKTTGVLTAKVSGYEQGKDATILILKKGAELATAGSDDIIYIDQIDGTKIAADGTYTFTAPIKERAAEKSAAEVNLYVGGENVTAAKVYTKAGDTGATDINLSDGGDTPEASYVASVPTGTYKTIDEAIAALVVKKTEGATTTTLTSSDYTVEKVQDATDANKYTLIIKVGGAEVARTTATVTPDTPTPGTATGIKGEVKYALSSGDKVAPYALVLVTKTNSADIVKTAVTGADGKFEIEGLDAGDYRVIVRWVLLRPARVTNYPNAVTTVTVTEGNMTTAETDSKGYIRIRSVLTGDTNEDGKVDGTDYSNVVNNYGKSVN